MSLEESRKVEPLHPLEHRVDLEKLDGNEALWQEEAERIADEIVSQIIQNQDKLGSSYIELEEVSGLPGRNELSHPQNPAADRSEKLSEELPKLIIVKLAQRGIRAEIAENNNTPPKQKDTTIMLYQNVRDDLNSIGRNWNNGGETSSFQRSIWEYQVRRVSPHEIQEVREVRVDVLGFIDAARKRMRVLWKLG